MKNLIQTAALVLAMVSSANAYQITDMGSDMNLGLKQSLPAEGEIRFSFQHTSTYTEWSNRYDVKQLASMVPSRARSDKKFPLEDSGQAGPPLFPEVVEARAAFIVKRPVEAFDRGSLTSLGTINSVYRDNDGLISNKTTEDSDIGTIGQMYSWDDMDHVWSELHIRKQKKQPLITTIVRFDPTLEAIASLLTEKTDIRMFSALDFINKDTTDSIQNLDLYQNINMTDKPLSAVLKQDIYLFSAYFTFGSVRVLLHDLGNGETLVTCFAILAPQRNFMNKTVMGFEARAYMLGTSDIQGASGGALSGGMPGFSKIILQNVATALSNMKGAKKSEGPTL